ncbi:hypothetical protein AVEN_250349-1, partial [Araneus ventricosus]
RRLMGISGLSSLGVFFIMLLTGCDASSTNPLIQQVE